MSIATIMENTLPVHLQEIICSSSDPNTSRRITLLAKEGQIRKIAPRIYTSNFTDNDQVIVKRNIFTILGKLYPNALLSHRSALEFQPTSKGHIFVTYSYTKKISLPGITLRFLQGPEPTEGDTVFSGELYVSQKERAFLENLQVSRRPGAESKTLTLPELEAKLEQIVRVNGEEALNEFRDRARKIAGQLAMNKEFERLDKLISALLTTHTSRILISPLAKARAFGNPYDPARIELLETLFLALNQQEFKNYPDANLEESSFKNFAFFEAYFSNYIEGTIFELEEAKDIIETQKPLPSRNDDSHDILGTYKLVSSMEEMSIVPNSAEEFLKILRYRHQVLLMARVDKKPGEFKDKNNRAGNTFFVDYKLVRGTLIKGFEYYNILKDPFAKAAYMMFFISEVHPFLDGNGRVARIMMNAELVKAGQTRIMIPTVYRDDYLGALRRLTRKAEPDVYIRMLQRAQSFCAVLSAASIDDMEWQLERSNAFKEHDEARLKF